MKPHPGRGYGEANGKVLPIEEAIKRRETSSLKTPQSPDSEES